MIFVVLALAGVLLTAGMLAWEILNPDPVTKSRLHVEALIHDSFILTKYN